MPRWTKLFMSVCVSLINKVTVAYLKQKALIVLELPIWRSLQVWLWENVGEDPVKGSQLEHSVWLLSQKCLALFATVAKNQISEDDTFWLEKEERKNYSGVLVTVADSERGLEKLGKKKRAWSCKIIKGVFARHPKITLLRTSDWWVSFFCLLQLVLG